MPAAAPLTNLSALVVMGVSGVGKSTIGGMLARRLGWEYEDGDWFHPQSNIDKTHAGHPLTDEDRWPWLRAIARHIDETRKKGGHAIIACSALKRAYRDILVGDRPEVGLIYLKGDRNLVARRLATRYGHFMSPQLLESQFATLEEPQASEHPIVVSIDAPPRAIIETIVAKLGISS